MPTFSYSLIFVLRNKFNESNRCTRMVDNSSAGSTQMVRVSGLKKMIVEYCIFQYMQIKEHVIHV